MKKIQVLILLFLSLNCLSQNYKAVYRLEYVIDSTKPTKVNSEKFTLLIKNNKESIFASDITLYNDSLYKTMGNIPFNRFDVANRNQTLKKTQFNFIITKEFSKKKATIFDNVFLINANYYFDYILNWIITDSIKIINQHKCILAKCNYAGRNYNAWFTNDIPIADGPYLFSGLPGFIFELSDDKKHYQFKLESFENTEKYREEKFNIEKKSILMERAQFLDLRLMHQIDPIGFIENKLNIKSLDENAQIRIKNNVSKRYNFIELKW